MSQQGPLSPHFGDYPHGRYVSAFPPPGARVDDDDGFEVEGVIRFRMPEEDVDFPLWDDGGLLPDEPEILQAGLGLSAGLVTDLKAWGAAWNDTQARTEDARELHRDRLRAVAATLIDRLRGELRDGVEVVLDLE